jgi:hypothetical protein
MAEKRKRGRPFKGEEARTELRTLRLPAALDARIVEAAQRGKRSFSDEVILRIEQSLASEEQRRQEVRSLIAEAVAGRGGPEAAKRLAELYSEAVDNPYGIYAIDPSKAHLRAARSDTTSAPAPAQKDAQADASSRRRSKKVERR